MNPFPTMSKVVLTTAVFALPLQAQTRVVPQTMLRATGEAAAAPVDLAAEVRLLGGLDTTIEPARKLHNAWMTGSWRRFATQRREPMRRWSRNNVPRLAPTTPVLYPFGGVDLPSALALYPDQQRYVLVGLEPVGLTPAWSSLSTDTLGAELARVREASRTLLAVGFLRTNDMAAALTRIGAIPVLLALLAREEATVLRVTAGGIAPDGSFEAGRRARPGAGAGVRIEFRLPRDAITRSLEYLSLDLSDGGLRQTGLLAHLATFGESACMTKAATYLMHKPYFATVRQALLRQCTVLVQDDSGIPVRYLVATGRRLQVHGSYSAPIPMFKEWIQPELQQLARSAKPLPFGWGYRWLPSESTLLVATHAPTAH